MARKQVVEITCSRCERKEYRDAKAAPTPAVPPAVEHLIVDTHTEPIGAFNARLLNLEKDHVLDVKFEDLCAPCRRTILSALEQIGKRIEGVSPDRVQKTKAAPPVAKKKEAGPTGPTPSTTHAPAASKNPAATRSS